jgi:hypothetical protein
MDDVVEDLCAAVRRHETALRAVGTAGHRVTPDEVQRLEHMLVCCEQWLRILRANDALARSRAGSPQPSIRYSPRRAPPVEQNPHTGSKSRASRAS